MSDEHLDTLDVEEHFTVSSSSDVLHFLDRLRRDELELDRAGYKRARRLPPSSPVEWFVSVLIDSDLGMRLPLRSNPNPLPILRVLQNANLLDAWRVEPLCLRCGLPCDPVEAFPRPIDTLCRLCLIDHERVAREERAARGGQSVTEWLISRLEILGKAEIEPLLAQIARAIRNRTRAVPLGRPQLFRDCAEFRSTDDRISAELIRNGYAATDKNIATRLALERGHAVDRETIGRYRRRCQPQ